jgi:hypothetical protein
MPYLIKQGDTKIITKEGEIFVNIALELNIKLDGQNLQIGLNPNSQSTKQNVNEEKVNWEIPDFSSSNKINFGK